MVVNKAALNKLNIVQRYYEKISVQELSKIFGVEYFSNVEENTINHYFIYINEPKPIVLFHLSGGDDLLERTCQFPKLKVVLEKLPEINFHSLLFVLTNYYVFGKIDPIHLIEEGKKFEHVLKYDDLLSSTFGYLFYKHQLEQVISRLSNNPEINPEELRKAWNKKVHKTIAILDEIDVMDGVSLTDFIKSRSIEENHFVWTPNYRGAQLLWNYLLK